MKLQNTTILILKAFICLALILITMPVRMFTVAAVGNPLFTEIHDNLCEALFIISYYSIGNVIFITLVSVSLYIANLVHYIKHKDSDFQKFTTKWLTLFAAAFILNWCLNFFAEIMIIYSVA
jgi:hypothetical protein